MRSANHDVLPARVRRSLKQLGTDLGVARRKRQLTVEMVAQRVGVAKSTYRKVEQGDPTVSMGVYAMALFVLGFPEPFAHLADARRDATGLLLDAERLPKRVRVRKNEGAL